MFPTTGGYPYEVEVCTRTLLGWVCRKKPKIPWYNSSRRMLSRRAQSSKQSNPEGDQHLKGKIEL